MVLLCQKTFPSWLNLLGMIVRLRFKSLCSTLLRAVQMQYSLAHLVSPPPPIPTSFLLALETGCCYISQASLERMVRAMGIVAFITMPSLQNITWCNYHKAWYNSGQPCWRQFLAIPYSWPEPTDQFWTFLLMLEGREVGTGVGTVRRTNQWVVKYWKPVWRFGWWCWDLRSFFYYHYSSGNQNLVCLCVDLCVWG